LWVRGALSELGGAKLLTIAAQSEDLGVFSDFASALETATRDAKQAVEELQVEVKADFGTGTDSSRLSHIPIQALRSCISSWLQHTTTINDWVNAREALSNLRHEQLGLIADKLTRGVVPARS
jgi:hypothetical protein